MDFLPGGTTNKKAVSLGGRRKETKSREALLQEAKIKREQRNAAAAPAKASTIIQRHVRGLFTRRRLSAQFFTAAGEVFLRQLEKKKKIVRSCVSAFRPLTRTFLDAGKLN